jgi:adenylosuccinate synthase
MPTTSPTIADAKAPSTHGAEAAATTRGTGTVVVGLQWGDEGKGKIVDLLADRHDAVVRYNGGANAGHSVVIKGERFALHLIPSGVLRPNISCVIGNGVVVDPDWLSRELDGLHARGVSTGGLVISDRAHVVMPWHKAEDELRERWLSEGALEPIGTTKRGIGPCYADKALRGTAIRMGDLLRPEVLAARLPSICRLKTAMLGAITGPDQGMTSYDAVAMAELCAGWGRRFGPYIKDTAALLRGGLERGQRVLFEGANATLLDVDHGTYPYVTSSTCASHGGATGAGVPVSAVGHVLGVMKGYSTRVGGGPMPTELVGSEADRAIGEGIRQRGREFGTTTGRPRRVGWLDLAAVRYTARLNGAGGLCVMLLDVLGGLEKLRVCTAYTLDGQTIDELPPDAHLLARCRPVYQEFAGFGDITGARRLSDLPSGARAYLELIERTVGVGVSYVSVGPDREQTIDARGV